MELSKKRIRLWRVVRKTGIKLLAFAIALLATLSIISGRISLKNSLYHESLAKPPAQMDRITESRLRKMMVDNRDGHMGTSNMSVNATDFSEGQSSIIIKHLNGKKHGTFLEAGSYDGELLSNTFTLEYLHGFTGILVEPQGHAFQTMLTKHRRVAMLNACISPTGLMQNFNMTISISNNPHHRGTSALTGFKQVAGGWHEIVSVDCYPLINILEAAGLTKLDVLCLDVQGSELGILKSLPWNKVDIQLLVVEDDFPEPDIHQRVLREMDEILGKQGYKIVDEWKGDYFFKRIRR